MGFVEGILCKVHHLVINMGSYGFRDTVALTARYVLFCVTVDKVSSFFFHDGLLLFTHGTTHQVASSKAVTAQVTDNLHNLLLINNTAVGRRKNRLQLRTVVCHHASAVLSLNILGNKVHGAGTIEGNTRNNIFQVFRTKLLHEALHTAAF